MHHRQRGATFLGMVVILLILGGGLYAAIRLVPVYIEYAEVVRALEEVRAEYSSIDANPRLIRNSLERRWEVEDIDSISWRDIEITKTADGYDVEAAYEVERPFVANVFLVAKFDKLVTIQQ